MARGLRTRATSQEQSILQLPPVEEGGRGPAFPDVPNKLQKMDPGGSSIQRFKCESQQQHWESLRVLVRTDQRPPTMSPRKVLSRLEPWVRGCCHHGETTSLQQGGPNTSAFPRSTVSLLGKTLCSQRQAGWPAEVASGPQVWTSKSPSDVALYQTMGMKVTPQSF